LTILNLHGNYLQSAGVIKVAKALQHISSLNELYISYNNITEQAVDDIAAAVSHNTNLTVLNFSGNN